MDILISTEKLSLSPEMLRELAACRKDSEAAVYACLQKIIDDTEKFRSFHSDAYNGERNTMFTCKNISRQVSN